jgi:hypothetical protein
MLSGQVGDRVDPTDDLEFSSKEKNFCSCPDPKPRPSGTQLLALTRGYRKGVQFIHALMTSSVGSDNGDMVYYRVQSSISQEEIAHL